MKSEIWWRVLLGTEHEFSRNFRIPIEAGQHKDSSPGDVAYMRRRAYALNQRLKTILHRRDFDVLRSFLPPKFEYGRLTDVLIKK